MKGIIIYESLHGSTEKCAKMLTELIGGDIQTARLHDNEYINIDEFDVVIVGGSIHMGVIQTRVENFLKNNHEKLREKQLGLYLCCMEEGEIAREQFDRAYPAEFRKKAIATGLFGGEFNLRRMSFFEKKLTRRLTGIKSSVPKINEEEIRHFAKKINLFVTRNA
jgi:menaquinone-dependent protoporphyrinogen oxidase